VNPISQYLKELQKHLATGEATEHTYRPALKALIEFFGKQVTAINEPKRVACGAPDFIVTRERTPLGYIEAKDIGKNLDEEERSEQMARYLDGLSNLILTDYLEFRWYENGKFVDRARLARLGAGGKLREEPDGAEKFTRLISNFLSSAIPTIGGPKELAARMAALARLIRDVILRAFDDEDKGGSLHVQMQAFRKVLLHDLEPKQFADMYAQTISYGLFAARCNHPGGTGVSPVEGHGQDAHATTFTRKVAAYDIPKTNPFLRKMFNYIAGPDLDERVTWAVDHLAELLRRADTHTILKNFGKRTRREDPVVHFYETFLAAYDPKMREARGVYYTPEPVVSYIVRSVDYILKKDFGLKDGLADTTMTPVYRTVKDKNGETRRKKVGECHKVLILDPACGTGTFLYGVIDHIHQQLVSKGQKGAWSGYVSKHLLPRLFGFELLMAPYAVAHMKLSLQLAETGYDFKSGERLRIYLTNALEEPHEFADLDLFASTIAEEANAASEVKSEAPVMVILGNPPYSGHSANKGKWIRDLLRGIDSSAPPRSTGPRGTGVPPVNNHEQDAHAGTEQHADSGAGRSTGVPGRAGPPVNNHGQDAHATKTPNYFEVDGKPLGERNPKWLNDDYVKFIRFAQW